MLAAYVPLNQQETSVMNTKIRTMLASAVFVAAMTPEAEPAIAAGTASQVPYRYAVSDASTQPEYINVVRRRRRRRYVVKRRSKKKSAAIVAGSAATGAAIGGIAGGGKGAGIGAIAGGAAGFVYDRKTHKKVVRQY